MYGEHMKIHTYVWSETVVLPLRSTWSVHLFCPLDSALENLHSICTKSVLKTCREIRFECVPEIQPDKHTYHLGLGTLNWMNEYLIGEDVNAHDFNH